MKAVAGLLSTIRKGTMTKPLIGIGTDVKPGDTRDSAFAYLTYVEALKRAGAVPVLIPPQPENATEAVAGLDGILLAGGDDCDPTVYGEEPHPTCEPMDPRRQQNDLALARAAHELGVPTLGICLGVQIMNVAAGGTLIQHIESEIEHASSPADRKRHDIQIHDQTYLATLVGAGSHNVNSSHHQAIRTLGQGLRVTALAPDGIIEGLEDPAHPFYVGVQWHPEDMNGESSASSLFTAFVKAAARRAAERARREAVELSPL